MLTEEMHRQIDKEILKMFIFLSSWDPKQSNEVKNGYKTCTIYFSNPIALGALDFHDFIKLGVVKFVPSLCHQTPTVPYKPCSLKLSTHSYFWATEQLQNVDPSSGKVLPKHNIITICSRLKIGCLLARVLQKLYKLHLLGEVVG